MDDSKSRVAYAKTSNRKEGVKSSIKTLGQSPAQGKHVLIKPNFNTADLTPGSTHNDTLAALVDELWAMGARTIRLGERSFPPTAKVMEEKGVLPLLAERSVEVVDFDRLDASDWVEVNAPDSHWQKGFRVARPILEAECLVSTCCLKTHQFGGVFTLSLKLHVGVVPTTRHGFDYMRELHGSPYQRHMIAEINAPFKPDLIVLDGIEAFVDGGPSDGRRARADVFLASADRVAVDAVGVALLKHLGSNQAIMGRPIFAQDQIARAVELGLGASGPDRIELVPSNEAGKKEAARVMEILNQG